MNKLIILLAVFLCISISVSFAQVQPLSRADSGTIINYTKKYEELLEQNSIKEATRYLNDIAFIYWNHNLYKNAADYYEKSLALNSQIANENGIAMLHNNLGMLYADLQQYEKSLESFTKTLASRRSNKENVGIISALINRAVVYNNLKKHDLAIEDLQEALGIARSMNDLVQMKSVYGMLSEAYEKNGDIEQSLQYFELYRSFHEQVNTKIISEVNKKLEQENIQKKLAEAEVNAKELEILRNQIQLAEKEKEINTIDSVNQYLFQNLDRAGVELRLLETDAKLKEQIASAAQAEKAALEKQQRLTYIIAFILIAAAAVIIAITIYNYNRIRNVNEKLKTINHQLNIQKIELAEANEIKTKLFSIIAHDFRSPLYALKSLFYVVDDYKMPEEVKQPFEHLKIQLVNTTSLVENLLNWTKTQMASANPKIESVTIKNIVDENIALAKPMADNKNITITNNVNNSHKVNADAGMLQVVLRNLIQNALKFTHAGGFVTIDTFKKNGKLEISVSDTGIGMDHHQIEKLFKLKTKEKSLGTDDEPGSGLGLYLCHELIKRNNGDINVKSVIDKGTTFTFSLTESK